MKPLSSPDKSHSGSYDSTSVNLQQKDFNSDLAVPHWFDYDSNNQLLNNFAVKNLNFYRLKQRRHVSPLSDQHEDSIWTVTFRLVGNSKYTNLLLESLNIFYNTLTNVMCNRFVLIYSQLVFIMSKFVFYKSVQSIKNRYFWSTVCLHHHCHTQAESFLHSLVYLKRHNVRQKSQPHTGAPSILPI